MHKREISRQQVSDWTENPVTILFRELAEKESEEMRKNFGVDVYHPYQPQKTQEILANLNGAVDTWDLVIESLLGQGLLEEEDDGEQERNIPEW
jgi:hypothetical protein